MSNSLAIAAVTETMRQLLERCINASVADDPGTDPDLAGTSVTTRPPDKARGSSTGNQVNLFLYQTSVNSAWRNQNMPRQVKPNETGLPPLPLNLMYILTAFGADDEGAGMLAHRLLGRSMSILHDAAALSRGDIQAALAGNDLYEQVEVVRVIPHPITTEEISRLWTAFQTPYRISASYLVSVVLIESGQPVRAPLPVLARGKEDRGPFISATLPPQLNAVLGQWTLPIAPPPLSGPLTRVIAAPGGQAIARLGESLLLRTANLPDSGVKVRLDSDRLAAPVELDPTPGSKPGELILNLPGLADLNADGIPARAVYPPGFYTLALVIRQTDLPTVTTNALPFMLAPQITPSPLTAPAGSLALTVTCDPRLVDGQARRVFLLFGSQQLAPDTISTPGSPSQPTTLTFHTSVPASQKGVYTVRLRVDGVDSLPFVVPQAASGPAAVAFDPQQQVTIT